MEGDPGSGLTISQLLQALNKAVDNLTAEARRYGVTRFAIGALFPNHSPQDDPQYGRGLPSFCIQSQAKLTTFEDEISPKRSLGIFQSHESARE